MNWRNVVSRLRGRPPALEADLDEELAFHREMKEQAFRERGLSDEDARSAARRALGNVTVAREEARAAWRFSWIADLAKDLGYGWRGLRREPGFTLPAVLALTAGLGLNGLLFTIYNTLALAPWAIRDAENTVQVLTDRGGRWGGMTWPEHRFLSEKTGTLAALTAWDTIDVRAKRDGATWQADAVVVSANYFDAIGTGFALGRGFLTGPESQRNPPAEVVLHYEAWQGRFGGDPGVLGQWMEINGQRVRIAGVAAPGFSGVSPETPDFWFTVEWARLYLKSGREFDSQGSCCAQAVGRLKPGVGREAAREELSALISQHRESIGGEKTSILLTAPSFLANPSLHSQALPAFLLIALASVLVLLLASANVGNLLLARGAARQRELAVRLSLGAGRGRLLRQMTAESLLLSLLAGGLTLAMAATLPPVIVRWVVDPEDRIAFSFALDWRVVGFVLAASMATTLLFALAPARHAVREGQAIAGLQEGGRGGSRGNRLRLVLLTAQVALCAILLSSASLLIRAAQKVRDMEPGFRHAGAILLETGLDSSGVNEEQAAALLERLRDRLAVLPGVTSMAHTTVVPLGNSFTGTRITHPQTGQDVGTGLHHVSAGYFEALRIPLREGRSFTRLDESREDVAMMNEALAAQMWPGESAAGKTFQWLRRPVTIVGVVGNVSVRELGRRDEPHLYFPSRGWLRSAFLISADASAAPLLAELPALARETDSRFLATASSLSAKVQRAQRSAGVAASMAGAISGVALVLAFVGLHGVASYHLVRRTREIGVRMALGAEPSQVVRLITGQSLRPVLLGGALGAAGSLGAGQLLAGMLYGVSPADPFAVAGTVAVLAGVALLAICVPAARAASINPADTLRHE
ncbi:MAG TPA: hypothetical protein DEH78_05485 [Solibacterales bacterium]|nr:hypothetical protein [Bryobacterales bacterium]